MRLTSLLASILSLTAIVACGSGSDDPARTTSPLTGSGSSPTSGGTSSGDAGGEVCPSGGGAANADHVCSSDSSWKSQAQANCAEVSLELGTFTPDEYCGKGSSDSVTWTCCTAVAPAEPTCSIHELTSSCTLDSTLSSDAEKACASTGNVLETLIGNEACAKGESTAASYTCCPYAEPVLPAFPVPPSPDLTWAFYDNPQAMTVFETIAPQAYVQFSAREGQTLSATLTAMRSAEIWTVDPTKQIDGAIFEGRLVGSKYVWTEIARGSSEGGVLSLTARSGGSDRIHVVAYEAASSSYPSGISPAVSASLDLTCATGHHADCALGGEPGDSCTVSPASCDGPVTWCFSPEGACSNHGECQRIDIGCPGIIDPVCTCSDTTEINSCYATVDKQSLAYNGSCTSGAKDASAPPPMGGKDASAPPPSGGGGEGDASAPAP